MISVLFRRLGNAIDIINKYLAYIATSIIVLLTPLTCYAVFMRYFFSNPPGWDIEVTEYMLLFIAFLGAAWILKERRHVSVDLIYEQLNPKGKQILDIIVSIMGAIICLTLTWYSVASTWDHFLRGAMVTGTLNVPKAVLLGVMPVGFFLLTAEFVKQTIGYLRPQMTTDKLEENATVEEQP